MYETTHSAGADDVGGSYSGPRWSYHLARPPGYLIGADASTLAYYHRIYDDPSIIDPESYVGTLLDQFRAEAQRRGVRVDEGDAEILVWVARGEFPPDSPGLANLDEAYQQELIATYREAQRLMGEEPDEGDESILVMLESSGIDLSPDAFRSVAVTLPRVEPRVVTSGGAGASGDSLGAAVFSGGVTSAPSGGAVGVTSAPGGGLSPLVLIALAAGAYFLLAR